MMFNFRGLHSAFLEMITRHEPSIAFTLTDGKGKFVFFLFLNTNSAGKIIWGNHELFVFLANTQHMLRFDLKGNHRNAGDFKIWLDDKDEAAIRAELGLGATTAGGPAFLLNDFLNRLDGKIPTSIPLVDKIATIQNQSQAVQTYCASYLENASKIYLLGKLTLSKGKHPQEQTLRKLYMLNAAPRDIELLIQHLKRLGWTTRWTASKPSSDAFAALFTQAATAKLEP